MAFEKAKVLKAAEKFLSQGKISAAIKEYRQIVDNDQSDLTALNMLGDLCVRASKTDEAISCFQRIAEHYSEQEFTLKAIAMYKKIDRLKPRDPYIANKLANLYGTQGLVVDARAQYLVVADAYTRAGQSGKALDVFHKIADLDPQNTEIRLKLAEGYVKENMRREAADAFVEAARRFYDTRAYEKALDSFNKAFNLTPGQNVILRGILSSHVALGTADEAGEILTREVEQRPDDRELVVMLVEACLEADDAQGAERAASILIGHDNSDYSHLISVAKLYLKLGEVEETVRVVAGIVEQMLAGREENELLEIVNEVLARNPDHVGALRLLVRVNWWQRDMDALRASLERMAEAAQAGELVDDERYALTHLVRLAPDEQRFLERLNQIGGIQEEAAEENLRPTDGFGEVPQFETVSTSGHEIPASAPTEQMDQFEWEVVTAESQRDPSASFAELSESADHTSITFDEFETHRADESKAGSFAEASAAGTPADTGEQSKRDAMMRQELESVDFYLSQGYIDIAADTLEMLVRQFGPHPEIQSRRDRLKDDSAKSAVAQPEVFEFGEADEVLAGKELIATEIESPYEGILEPAGTAGTQKETGRMATSTSGPGIDAGLAEIFEEFRIAAEEEQPAEREDFETHYNMGTAYKEMDLLDDAIHEFQTAASLVRPGDGTSRFLQCCTMLGHCFVQKGMPRAAVMWFQKGLDARGHEEEQKALRYELASVFELMGDLEQAHDLYSEVYGVDVGYREVSEKLRQLETKKQRRTRKRRKTDE